MFTVESPLRLRVVCLALCFGTLLLFGRAVGHDFVNYDDPDYVTTNEQVQAGLTWAGVRWAFTTGDVAYWHPVTWISHMADWELFGENPHGHHATSIGWHALTAVLAFLALRRLTGAFWASAFCAALWAWHPLRVESVAWVAERKDVLSGFFWMLALWAYAVYAVRRRDRQPAAGRFYALALAAFAGGAMCKPTVVTFPCVLLLLDVWPLGRLFPARPTPAAGKKSPEPSLSVGALWWEKTPFFFVTAAVGVVTYLAQRKVGTVSDVLSLDARLANAAVAVARYLGKFFWPFDLAVLYPHPGTWPGGAVIGAVLLIFGITGIALWHWRRHPWLPVGWFWFLGTLVPTIGLVQVGVQSMADRYTYLSIFGVQLMLVWTVRGFAVTPATRRWGVVAAASILAGCGWRTWDQLGVWQNSYTLFDHATSVTERNSVAYNNLGHALYGQHRIDEAMACYRRALEYNPGNEEAHVNLGYGLAKMGFPGEAVAEYRMALRTKPDLLEAHNNLGNALSDLGQIDEAMREYEFVLARRPRHADALNNYGVALAMKGRTAEAMDRIGASLRVKPDNASAHVNLGNVYAMTGRSDDAIREYRRALELSPNDAGVYNNLGNIAAEKGQLGEAVAQYEQAIRLVPVNPEAHANLGFALAKLGRRDEAIRQLQTALQQRPDYPQAQGWLQAVTAPSPGGK